MNSSLVWFPAVGLVIGAVVVACDGVVRPLVAAPLASFVVVGVLVVLSGGLHFDGLIDSADGLFGAGTPDQRLSRMRQSWAAPRGAIAGLGLLVTQYAAVGALTDATRVTTLLLAPALGRWAIVFGYAAFPYVAGGSAYSLMLKSSASARILATATALTALLVVVRAGPLALLLLVFPLLVALGIGRLAMRRLGGMSGDVYGAVEVLVETGCLLAIPGLIVAPA